METSRGQQCLYQVEVGNSRSRTAAFLAFRHGVPHRLLPHQIDVRRLVEAFARVDCQSLLVTSSVGVLDPSLPLHCPLLVDDLITLDNRLPDGSPCTMWPQQTSGQGHLVLSEGAFSHELGGQLRRLGEALGLDLGPGVVFGYCPGPRTKTRAENRMWFRLGAQVNSMTLAPEVILANELGIPCVALVVGHKYSHPDHRPLAGGQVSASLELGRESLERLVCAFLEGGSPVSSRNHLYRFGDRE